MKRRIGMLLLLALAAVLLAGCAGSSAEQEAAGPTEPAAAESAATETPAPTARDWSEPNAVDDSFSFSYTRGSSGDYLLREALPAYVDRWVDGGEILDTKLIRRGNAIYGWICFTGTPKGELGWRTTQYQGQECYCRGLFIHVEKDEDSVRCHAAQTIAMEPLWMLPGFEQTEDGEYLLVDKTLPALQSAELYVPQLGRSFIMTDPEALRGLERSFSVPEFENMRVQEQPAMAWVLEPSGFLPLYLHYSDGSSSLALAAGDGSDFCLVREGEFSVFGAVSLFERFGVPLPSPGYTRNDDGTTVIEDTEEGVDGSLQLRHRHDYRYTFDAEGRLVRYEHKFHREDNDFDQSETRIYHYRPDGKIESVDVHGESARNGGFDYHNTYTYNERGQIICYRSDDQNDETRGMYYEYVYDEQNRLTAVIYHYRDGREGLPSGNSYFWYDEQGRRRAYGVDQDGNLVGGPEDEDAGAHPMRR